MRTLITGVDSAGRSCVVSQGPLDLNEVAPGFAMGIPYATSSSPPPARPAGTAPLIDQFIAPGHVRWMVVDLGPGTETPAPSSSSLPMLFSQSRALPTLATRFKNTSGSTLVSVGMRRVMQCSPRRSHRVTLVAGASMLMERTWR